jgi:hypothetical protein
MSATPVEVEGTLKPDGTLELDARINLPAGRVRVTVQPLAPVSSPDPFLARMEGIWAEQRARGHVPRSESEVEAERRAARDESEEELRAAERIHQECEQAKRPPGGTS